MCVIHIQNVNIYIYIYGAELRSFRRGCMALPSLQDNVEKLTQSDISFFIKRWAELGVF